MYVRIYIYIYIYIYTIVIIVYTRRQLARFECQDTGGAEACLAGRMPYGQFSKYHVCFCGLDSGNLKFETVRTHKQHIRF